MKTYLVVYKYRILIGMRWRERSDSIPCLNFANLFLPFSPNFPQSNWRSFCTNLWWHFKFSWKDSTYILFSHSVIMKRWVVRTFCQENLIGVISLSQFLRGLTKTHISMFLSLSIVCAVNSLQKFEEKRFLYHIVQLVYRIICETCFLKLSLKAIMSQRRHHYWFNILPFKRNIHQATSVQ